MALDELTLSFDFAEVAAGTDEDYFLAVPMPGTWKLEAAYFASKTARTADDTNYSTLSVENGGTTIASAATTTGGTGDLTAGEVVELSVSGSGTDLEFAQGDAVTVGKTDSGTGLALDGAVTLYFSHVRA